MEYNFDFDNTYQDRLKAALASGKICIVPHRIKEREKNMRIQLKNGMVVEGTLAQVSAVARQFGESVQFEGDGYHYNSASRGLVVISAMDTQHLRNALLKRYATFVESLKQLDNNRVAAEISNPSDKTLVGLMAEFSRRKIAGRL
jgi:hypothetical protein